jgi:hypothetical protein
MIHQVNRQVAKFVFRYRPLGACLGDQVHPRDIDVDLLFLGLLIANGLCPPLTGLKRKHNTVEPSTDKDAFNPHRIASGPSVQKIIPSRQVSASRFQAENRASINIFVNDNTENEAHVDTENEILHLKVNLLSRYSPSIERHINSQAALAEAEVERLKVRFSLQLSNWASLHPGRFGCRRSQTESKVCYV